MVFLMLTLVGMGYWAYDSNLHVGTQKKQPQVRENADYYLIDTQITQYNQEGDLDYILVSDSITHYPHNDTTLLQTPHLENFSNPQKPVVTDALHGKLLPGNEDIELWDDVVMTQTDLNNGSKVRVDTDFMTIYSEKGLAVTDRPVLITNDTGRTRAIGMEAFYKESLIKLKSRVRGFHEPKP
ncbi:LPS export ABC transporter periplasmic protein LptC [Endozoicomonas sp. 4G]|uniref:LPS export ABC transporter periplasmic protein LptC n=1 Tax=Endozoicomonas sp. 4G TaxID=2872754 RepID=UPI0020786D35|nr:LPS export ABC transporter periplasmic protein LptC [Endozoicomonas sp. 4G]